MISSKGDSKHKVLSIENPDSCLAVAKALSVPERLRIISLLEGRTLNVNEIAHALDIPSSSAAVHVRVLEQAGLIASKLQPGTRGSMKVCSRCMDKLEINLVPFRKQNSEVMTLEANIGEYATVRNIKPTCGLATQSNAIGFYDNPNAFYLLEHINAEVLWFTSGFVDYQFGILDLADADIGWLEISMEACSEGPMYREQWPSDITVMVNDKKLGVWHSPGECGGHPGEYNPSWWPDSMAQFGLLTTWWVDNTGCYVNQIRVSDVTLADLQLNTNPCIKVSIGVEEDAEYVGGINLFGKHFGNYPQGLRLRVGTN